MKNWFVNLTTAVFAAFFLAACGGDSGSTNSTPKISDADYEADSYRELPSCTESRDGETAYVVDQDQGYICKKGKWVEDDEAVEIRSSSSEGKTSVDAHAEEDDPASYVPEKIVPIKSKTITGFAQKGPFKAGATVDIFELELDGKTFAQTGKSFTGKVLNDSGVFTISNVSLKSQYALLRVTGNFISEINGESVHAMLTAVADLSKREKVNVNILTHLEYDRVLYLLGKGMNFTSAKKQAEREVFAAFGIEGKFANSEDLDVLGETDADISLAVISRILLAGKTEGTNRDEEDLVEVISKIATDLEEDGEWNHYGKIGWSGHRCGGYRLSPTIEICDCNELDLLCRKTCHYFLSNRFIGHYCKKTTEGDFFCRHGNVKSEGDITACFLCADGEWLVKTEEEADEINQWGIGKDGEVKTGAVTGHKYIYDMDKGLWRVASYEEQGGTYGALVDSRDGHSYRTVVIGSQIWMAENLSYDKGLEGVTYSEDNVNVYYTWDAANNACPEGWHLPDNLEWETLYNTVKTNRTPLHAVQALLIRGNEVVGVDCSNASGFSAFPVSACNDFCYHYGDSITEDECVSMYGYACYWSATGNAYNNAYYWTIKMSRAEIYGHGDDSQDGRYQGRPVRCVKD